MYDWQVSITAREDVPPFGPPLPSPPIFTEVRTHDIHLLDVHLSCSRYKNVLRNWHMKPRHMMHYRSMGNTYLLYFSILEDLYITLHVFHFQDLKKTYFLFLAIFLRPLSTSQHHNTILKGFCLLKHLLFHPWVCLNAFSFTYIFGSMLQHWSRHDFPPLLCFS